MHDTWLLVANRAGARLFAVRDAGRALALLESLENPRGRLHEGDLDADRPGRAFDIAGAGRHALGREESSRERVAADFARFVADRLATERKAGRFDALVVAAEPRFLGLIRAALDEPTARCVVASDDRDLVACDVPALLSHLGAQLAPAAPR